MKHNQISGATKVAIDAYIAKYQPDKASIAERIAKVLFDLSKIAPEVPISKGLVTKAVLNLKITPNAESDKVKMVNGQIAAARVIMRDKYACSIHTETYLGWRATTTSTDQARTRVAATSRRLVSAHQALAQEAALVDAEKIEDPALKKWFKTEVKPTTKLLEVDDRIKRLLPPKKPNGPSEGGNS